ncbi:MAG: right-handed parallel beta-helix repeat-containing protein [Planctomycetes bacterium]|nr:right-handed parallel beta-helix repeat-containing protein [Planctomycetota bacterium]
MINWQASDDASWLSLDPAMGESAGEVDAVLLNVDVTGLSVGQYRATVTVTDPGMIKSRAAKVILNVVRTLRVPSAYPTVQAAVDAASYGDIVLVEPGRYSGVGNVDIDFKGKDITVRGEGGAEATIIDCQGQRGFYLHTGETNLAVVDGLTITGGATAIQTYDLASPTIRNCRIVQNTATYHAIMYLEGGNPVVSDCLISNNSGQPAIQLSDSRVTVLRCTISDNTAGGIIGWNSANAIIGNCAIVRNSCSSDGAGLRFGGSDCYPTIVNCVIAGNRSNGRGGGLAAVSGTINIVNCTIVGNSSGKWSGGVHVDWYTTARIANSIIRDNTGPGGGSLQLSATRDSGLSVRFCNLTGGTDGVSIDSYSTLDWGPGNIDDDPQFASSDNYRLMAGSPCVDAGDELAVPFDLTDFDVDFDIGEPWPVDLEGNLRFVDDPLVADTGLGTPPIVDMGAYEHFCAMLESSNPATGQSLWRNQKNIIRLTLMPTLRPPTLERS